MNARFQDQIRYVFDRPVSDPAWYWSASEEEADPFGEDSLTAFEFIERLCQQPQQDLAPYTNDQIALGLEFVFNASCSNLASDFKQANVPFKRKEAALHGIFNLFRDVFDARCKAEISAGSQELVSSLNNICYMFWDVCPLANFLKFDNKDELLYYALENLSSGLDNTLPEGVQDLMKQFFQESGVKKMSAEEIVEQRKTLYANKDEETAASYRAIARVMEQCLYLDNPACVESGLHGLGHLATFQSDIAVPIIDRFLAKNKKEKSPLIGYAKAARTGMIL